MITPDKLDILVRDVEDRAASLDAYIIARIIRRLLDSMRNGEGVVLIPASINEIHVLLGRGMVAEEIEIAIIEKLPGLRAEVRNAFLAAADDIALDYVAQAKMDTTEILKEAVKEGTGVDITEAEKSPQEAEKGEESDNVSKPEEQPQETAKKSDTEALTNKEMRELRDKADENVKTIVSQLPTMEKDEDVHTDSGSKPAEKTESQPGEAKEYPDFVETCGYGKMLGICGINCRHTISAFTPGVNIDHQEPIDPEKNEEYYRLTQKQRAMERKIRELERMIAALKALESDDPDVKSELKELRRQRREKGQEYAEFVKEHNLPSANWRFEISTGIADGSPAPGRLSRGMLNKSELEMMEDLYHRTNGEISNLCRTLAPATEQAFIDACDNAFMKQRAGMSMNTVITEAIREVSRQGITTVHYESGRTDRIEVAIARAVRTGINQANAAIVLGGCASRGIDYVRASSHLGARVTKTNDYTNHSWWQGKVYKLNWDDPALAKYKAIAGNN